VVAVASVVSEEAENIGKGGAADKVGGVVWAAIWMWPLLGPASTVLHGKVPPLAGVGLAAFVALYLTLVLIGFGDRGRGPSRRTLVGLAVLAVLGVALVAGYARHSDGWLSVLLYVGAGGASVLCRRQAIAWIIGTVAALFGLGLLAGRNPGELGGDVFTTSMACVLVVVIKQMMGYIHELRSARTELATAAVAEERLRFSRDLHELLGHTLSVMVVKAEVVRRLVATDPDRASAAAADIEELGRTALAEVREAVTGYRQRPFASELDGARDALTGAGIEVTVTEVGTPLPASADVLFGWAVREGATNVIRHSRARRCSITVRFDERGARLEVSDDGVGPGSSGSAGGHGLRGLRERLAAAGGTLSVSSPSGGGFSLVAELGSGPAAPGLRSEATREGVASGAQDPRERSERQEFGVR
jgi:two-component system, NarL family, sensor histidine kinase DesK